MSRKKAELLLAAVIIARSTSFIFSKISLENMGKFNLLSIRFLTAAVFLFIIFRTRLKEINKTIVLKGMALGFAFFCVMSAELAGLETVSTSMTSFLENTAIILVPLFEALLKKKFPESGIIISSIIAFIGVALLTLKSNISLSSGEIYCLMAALFYAAAIILTDRFSKNDNSLLIGIFQVTFLGIFSTIASFIFEKPKLPETSLEVINIIILAFICTGFGFTLQPVAQRYTSSEKAGLFCALNPAVAAILGAIFMHERMGIYGIIGAVFIIFSMFIPTLKEKFFKPSQK